VKIFSKWLRLPLLLPPWLYGSVASRHLFVRTKKSLKDARKAYFHSTAWSQVM